MKKKKTIFLFAVIALVFAAALSVPVLAVADEGPNCWGTEGALYFACYGTSAQCSIGHGSLQVFCKGNKMIVHELPSNN